MRYGICMQIDALDRIDIVKNAGFDYIECGFCKLSRAEDEVFEAFKAALEKNGMKCEAANGFLPKDLPLIGDEYDAKKTAEYIEKGMQRGVQVGLKTVVFGSSGARKVPEGVSYAEGFRQLGEVIRTVIAPLAKKYGITIVMEPLRKDECNIINTIKEGTMLAVLSGADNVFCLGDIYHMVGEGDTYDDVRQLKGSLKHAHINKPFSDRDMKREFPSDVNEFDYKGFVDALEYAGCHTCSIEGGCVDFESEAMLACKVLKSL